MSRRRLMEIIITAGMLLACLGSVTYHVTHKFIINTQGTERRTIINRELNAGRTPRVNPTMTIDEVIVFMHSMSNTLIIPIDGRIKGYEGMTRNNIDSMYVELHAMGIDDKLEELKRIIEKWDKADFSTIVDDHNRLWYFLNGVIGEAGSVKTNAVEEAVEKLKQ